METTGILHSRPLSRGVCAPVALLTLASVGRYGAVFPFASWADGTMVKLPTRILLKSLLFVVVSLRSFFKRARRMEKKAWLLVRPFSRASDLKSRSCSSEGLVSAAAVRGWFLLSSGLDGFRAAAFRRRGCLSENQGNHEGDDQEKLKVGNVVSI